MRLTAPTVHFTEAERVLLQGYAVYPPKPGERCSVWLKKQNYERRWEIYCWRKRQHRLRSLERADERRMESLKRTLTLFKAKLIDSDTLNRKLKHYADHGVQIERWKRNEII